MSSFSVQSTEAQVATLYPGMPFKPFWTPVSTLLPASQILASSSNLFYLVTMVRVSVWMQEETHLVTGDPQNPTSSCWLTSKHEVSLCFFFSSFSFSLVCSLIILLCFQNEHSSGELFRMNIAQGSFSPTKDNSLFGLILFRFSYVQCSDKKERVMIINF